MTLRLALALLSSFGTGFLLVALLWPEPMRLKPSWLLKLSLACSLGLGLSAEIYFLWLWTSTRSARGLFLADLLFLGGLAGALAWRKARGYRGAELSAGPPLPALPAQRSLPVERVLASAVLIALVPAALALVSAFSNQPHGGWDAWMSWNLRARFFFRAGEHWRDAFSSLFWGANPEYPVFLPSTVARLWQYAREETELAPALVAATFTLSTVALTYSSLRVLRSKGQGLMAALLLLGTPFFIRNATFQMADVPLGFFYLASLATLCLGDRLSPRSGGPFVLTGVFAGFAAWTKNEGMLFVATLAFAVVAVLAWKRLLRRNARQLLAFACGLLVVLPLALSIKAWLAPPDIMLDWNEARLHTVVEWDRYGQIVKAFLSEVLRFGDFPLQIAPLLAFYALLLRIDSGQWNRPSTHIALGALGLTLAGYGLVYLTTPQELAWHLRTSMHRVLLQLWPSAVFAYFLLLRTPEEALAESIQNTRRIRAAGAGPALLA